MRVIFFALSMVALALGAPSPETYGEAEFESGFVIPANIALEDYDKSTHFMTPVGELDWDNNYDLETIPADGQSADHSENSAVVSRAAKKQTKVFLGKTQVDYGCEASIRKTLGEAIHSLCRGGFCDGGSKYTRKVDHMDNSRRRKAWVQVEITGTYRGKHTRGHIAESVKRTVTPETAKPAVRTYYGQSFNPILQKCKMSKFTNYIHVYKNFGDDVNVQIRISLKTTNSFCPTLKVLESVSGAFNGAAGGFWGLVSLSCTS
ncbi:hypothetical protein NCS52_01310700 [Fusarium sp. LHS14.1]|nr:hypothetical protein NCS52_01310700 [Fusarium sp. LHS14.1]